MNKEERLEYIMYIQQLYDSWLYATDKRNISYGELAYIQDLPLKALKSMEKDLITELESMGVDY